MSTEVAVMQEMGNDKLELIKKTVAKGATDLELELFLHACKRTGLDPLMKQIYAIKRKDRASGGEVMAIQTGIDGYRLIADRTGHYAGSDEPQYVIAEDGWPDVASVTVHKMVGGVRCPFSASVRWKEYAQDTSPMWKKMPFLMLGKCAEALALRKAFPAELSGVYTHEEMGQADNDSKVEYETTTTFTSPPKLKAQSYTASKQTAQAKIAELKAEGERREDGADNTGQPVAASQQGSDAPAPFIWRVGKHSGKSVTEIPLDYLVWAATTITATGHRDAALAEIDRLQKQDVLRFEQEAREQASPTLL